MDLSKKRIKEVYWKSCSHEGYLNILIYRRISIYIAVLAAKMYVTPNQVTFTAFFLSLISAGMFATGNHAIALLGLLPFHIGKILDCADGQLASLADMKSKLGAFLDPFFDRIVDITTLFGLSLFYYINFNDFIALYLLIAMTSTWFIASYLDNAAGDDNKSLDNLRSFTSNVPTYLRRFMKWDGGFYGLITTIAITVPITIPFVVALFLTVSLLPLPMQILTICRRLRTE